MARNWRKTACLFHLALIKILLRCFSWVPQSAKLADFKVERFNVVPVFPLNCYHLNCSLQRLFFVSCCLIANLCAGGAAHSVLLLQHAQGWGCWAGQLQWGLMGLLPSCPTHPGAGGAALCCWGALELHCSAQEPGGSMEGIVIWGVLLAAQIRPVL